MFTYTIELEVEETPATIDMSSLIVASYKIVTRAATIDSPLPNPLNQKLLRLLICDFSERSLLYRKYKGERTDNRSWEAITVARQFANGLIGRFELLTAVKNAHNVLASAQDIADDAVSWAAYAAIAYPVGSAYFLTAIRAASYALTTSGRLGQEELEWQGRRTLWACGLEIPEPKLDEGF